MSTAVILGGGVSGLAAAYYLERATTKFGKIILLEASNRLGGWVSTSRYPDGAIFEHGPRSMRPGTRSGRNTLEMVEELGLTEQVLGVLGSSPASKNRFIYHNGQKHRLPTGPKALLKAQSPFSKALLWPVLKEPFQRRCTSDDETVDEFVRRRLGDEVADMAIDPMCRGIYAGDSRQLSLRAVFPDFFRFEREYGSLIKGLIRDSKGKSEEGISRLARKAKEERWSMWSLKHGMQQLTETLENVISREKTVEIRKLTPCSKLTFSEGKILVKTPDDELKADHIFAACSSASLFDLLPVDSFLPERLKKIPYVTTVVANIEYGRENLIDLPGFGHLLPSKESGPILGIIYDSCTFPAHDRKDRPSTRFTVIMGGAWYKELLTLVGLEEGSDELKKEKFKELATSVVHQHLGIEDKPIRTHISIQKNCIPNYAVGHLGVLEDMFQQIKLNRLPLSLIGASYRGASVNDCIHNSRLEVERIVGSRQ